MFKNISKLGANLSKSQQQEINGGGPILVSTCGGDGQFIYQDGIKVCCFQPGEYLGQGTYIC